MGLKDGTEEDFLLIRHFNINTTERQHGGAPSGIQAHVGKQGSLLQILEEEQRSVPIVDQQSMVHGCN